MHTQEFLDQHIAYTNPVYVMYVPKYKDYESDNVHLHVVDHPQFGGLIAFWTQSTIEGAGDNHAMMSRSKDGGKTWSEAKFIVGAKPSADKKEKQAHWAFPAVYTDRTSFNESCQRGNAAADRNRQLPFAGAGYFGADVYWSCN